MLQDSGTYPLKLDIDCSLFDVHVRALVQIIEQNIYGLMLLSHLTKLACLKEVNSNF